MQCVTSVMVRNGAIALLTCSQYERPYDPPPKPEKLSCTDRTTEAPGVQVGGPLIDRFCVVA